MNKNDLKKQIPHAAADQYYLVIFPDVPEQCTEGCVGFVGNKTNDKIKIRLIIDDKYMCDNNYRTLCLTVNEENYQESFIFFTSSFFEIFRNNEYLNSWIWHEIGHYQTGRYFDTKFENGHMAEARKKTILSGETLVEEQVADLFALYYMGKHDVLEAFRWTIRTRNLRKDEDDCGKAIAISELRNRRELIRIHSDADEDVEAHICALCNVSSFDVL